MRVLLDTNVVLDLILERDPFVVEAATLWELHQQNALDGSRFANMIFNYEIFPNDTTPKGYVEIPFLDVRLFYKGRYDDVGCLVDSGSDACLFPSSIAENLGIDLERGKPLIHYAFGDTTLQSYVHTVELQIFGFDERIQIEASFTRATEFSVLGQSGFFENYEVTFRGFEKTFEVTSKPQPKNVLPIKWPHPK